MKTATFKSLGLTVTLSVPNTASEFDSLAKRDGACLDEAVRNVVYRGSLAEFRDVLLHGRKASADGTQAAIVGMDEIFKMERETVPVLDDKGNPKKNAKGEELSVYSKDDSEEKFFKRIVASHNISEADQQKLADVVSAALVFDPSAAERKPAAPKKLAAKYMENAKKLIAGGKVEELNKRLHKQLGKTFTATGVAEADVESLGWLVKEFVESVEAQTMAKLVA
jgi:hypothetical protein